MPQTVEHAYILNALGVELGVIAITKADITDPADAAAEAEKLLPGYPIVPCSARTGTGIDELRALLERAVASVPSRYAYQMSDSPILALLAAIDVLDLDTAISVFAPDATLAMPNGTQAVGRDQVRTELGAFLQGLRATAHEVSSVWNPEPGLWIAEMSATYELIDFSRRGPYGRCFILRAGKQGIEQLRIYGTNEVPLPESGLQYSEVRSPHGWLPTL